LREGLVVGHKRQVINANASNAPKIAILKQEHDRHGERYHPSHAIEDLHAVARGHSNGSRARWGRGRGCGSRRTSHGVIRCRCCWDRHCARARAAGDDSRSSTLRRSPRNVGGAGADNHVEVGTADACLVGEVDDEASVTEVGPNTLFCGHELVVERHLKRIRCDLAVLAAQVADLASLREPSVTCRVLATEERIEMSQRLGAVAIARDRIDVDVVG
jgi:hypothetical protein